MSKRLEDFIRTNKEEFDDLEPSADLWQKIEKHLPAEGAMPKKREAKTFSLNFVLRVAASVILVMGICFVLYLRNEKTGTVNYAAINPVYAKQQIQYASQVESKRNELKTIAKSDPELYKEFSSEIAKMDSTYNRLNRDLINSPNQERVLRAMIRNLQIQSEILNQQLGVIEQLNQTKKEEKNDTKNI
jgi:septal ring factor EnvC (AmiA/AmiB activator)